MEVLIATNRLESFSGSEIIALELAQEFASRGHRPLLLANSSSEDVADEARDRGLELWSREELPRLSSFDLIWSQHLLFPLLLGDAPPSPFASRPWIVFAHLGPSEPYETAFPIVEEILADRVLANSPETRDQLVFEGLDPRRIDVFHNAAPAIFARSPRHRPESLRRLLVVNNNLPDDVSQALAVLRDQGLAITYIGAGGEKRRVQPDDLHRADAVVTIGKTVQYALRAGVPVFCYGQFGGPGWLDSTNFARAEYFNFSGRCCRWKFGVGEIVKSLLEGWSRAAQFAERVCGEDPERFRLELFVENLLAAAAARPVWEPAQCLALEQQWRQIMRLQRIAKAVRREVQAGHRYVTDIRRYSSALNRAEKLATARLEALERLSAQMRRVSPEN